MTANTSSSERRKTPCVCALKFYDGDRLKYIPRRDSTFTNNWRCVSYSLGFKFHITGLVDGVSCFQVLLATAGSRWLFEVLYNRTRAVVL